MKEEPQHEAAAKKTNLEIAREFKDSVGKWRDDIDEISYKRYNQDYRYLGEYHSRIVLEEYILSTVGYVMSLKELAADNLALRAEVERLKHYKSEAMKEMASLNESESKLRAALEGIVSCTEATTGGEFILGIIRSKAKAALYTKPEIKAKYDGARPHDVRGWKPEDDGHG